MEVTQCRLFSWHTSSNTETLNHHQQQIRTYLILEVLIITRSFEKGRSNIFLVYTVENANNNAFQKSFCYNMLPIEHIRWNRI